LNCLPAFYESVLIPAEVLRELQHPKSPLRARTWATALPSWCEVRNPRSPPDAALLELDAGERDAIQLALDEGVDVLLIDDGPGRREAVRRRLRVSGTLAVLEKAAQQGWIDFTAVLQRLEQTNFRLSASIKDQFLKQNQ
jgi:predicted nucleic acid-binding protein